MPTLETVTEANKTPLCALFGLIISDCLPGSICPQRGRARFFHFDFRKVPPVMKFYIDSANISLIESLMKTGIFYGVTTNPIILRASGIHCDRIGELAHRVADLGAREIFLQSWGSSADALLANGRRLAEIGETVVVKFPATREGLEAAAALAKAGARTCITAVYSPFQAVLAAAAGAAYVAPYLGRMNDAGRDGHELIAQMSDALLGTESSTEILAASIRSPEDTAVLASNGVRHITLSPKVAELLFREQLTIEAVEAFEAAAEELQR